MNVLTRSGKRTTIFGTGIVMVTIVLLCVHLNSMITDAPVINDGLQNLQSAYNLKTWGVFSKERVSGTPSPDNYREPLPPAVTAAFLYLLGDARACLNGDCISQGFDFRTIKKINIGWALIALCASAVLSYKLTGSRWAAVLVLLMIHYSFLRNPAYIDSLYTEIPAAALMLVSTLCLMRCFRKPGSGIFFLTGIIFGLLVLTKAIFFYVLFPLIAVVVVLNSGRGTFAWRMKNLFLLLFAVLLTVAPWVARNMVHFGSPQISGRGGLALYTRALINEMNAYEYRASFHFWGPGAYRLLVRDTKFDIPVIEYERNGRAERLNDAESASFFLEDVAAQKEGRIADTRSFYRTARAYRVKTRMDLRRNGVRNVENTADKVLRDRALAMIAKQPLRHLAATGPLAWRGLWCFYGGGPFTVVCAFSCAAFVLVCCCGLALRDRDVLAFAALPFLLFVFNVFFSNNLPRFNAPAIPFMIMSLAVIARLVLHRLNPFRKRGTKRDV